MIDIQNYRRAIAWLKRGLNELRQEPENNQIRLDLLHRFEVTHNVSEALLREVYVSLNVEEQAAQLSIRELLRRAPDEGVRLSSPMLWLRYGLLLEEAKGAWIQSAVVDLSAVLPVLPRYSEELDAFADSLQKRMAPFA